jgi:diaminohydroxyphosphoribosylaminopyrimidine deaminase/5-amino-6-(5-phosphoribosylamino)uracil reductase
MRRALELALKGKGHVAPNPLVGAVLVCEDTIIAEGYHRQYGHSHAEVNAIERVKDKEMLEKSVLYVNLEPCSHTGKTPPCADLIIRCKIPKVVIATPDSNPKVGGKGIRKLQNAGVDVLTGVLEEEARALNKRFFCFHQHHRPYVILKWAQSMDGYMDPNRPDTHPRRSYWISNQRMRMRVHRWRAEESAVFVGMNTLINDNPRLNVRHVAGKNPVRIPLDRNGTGDQGMNGYHFFDQSQASIVFHYGDSYQRGHVDFCRISASENPVRQILRCLYERQINSLIVEGGRQTLEMFLSANLWDEARIIQGNICLGGGLAAPALSALPSKIEDADHDKLLIYKNEHI